MHHREHSHTVRFRCKNGLAVYLIMDDDGDRITAYTDDDGDRQRVPRVIGALRFTREEDAFSNAVTWLLTHAYLDRQGGRYLRQGIGREMLKLHIAVVGEPIYARQNDGLTRDDGSHLTGDAPGWVQQMRTEGLIVDDVDRGGDALAPNVLDDVDDDDHRD